VNRQKALSVVRYDEAYEDIRAEFIGSEGWCYRFMKRHDLVIRTRTTLAQALPADLDDKVISFHRFVIRMVLVHDVVDLVSDKKLFT
jgi:hypothetical protein